MSVGDRIKIRRQELGFTVDDLADRIGKVGQPFIGTKMATSKTCR